MSNVKIFENPEFGQVRVIVNENNEPLFCLTDVCGVLELTTSKVVQRLDDDVLSKYPISDSLGREQLTNFVGEDGLYDVILDSRKETAKIFRKWVTKEVLPSIRKTGSYSVAPKTSAELLLAQAQLLVDLERRQVETEQTIRHQQEELNSLKSDMDHMIEVRETAKEQLEFLPLSENTSPEQTLRSKINQIVKAYVSLTGVSYPEAWDSVYKNLYYKYSISVRAIKPIKKGENNLSKLERKGHLEAVYTVVSEMLRDGK